MTDNTIHRRVLIRSFLIVSAGVVFLPSCIHNDKASIVLKHLSLTGDDEACLGSLCEWIVPQTDTPGSKELGLHLFVMKMLDDCYLAKDQAIILKGMRDFKEMVRKYTNETFEGTLPAQRKEILQTLEKNKTVNNNLSVFYTTVKKLTIQGFITSQYYLTKVHKYELIPGRFHGCVPLTPSSAGIKTI